MDVGVGLKRKRSSSTSDDDGDEVCRRLDDDDDDITTLMAQSTFEQQRRVYETTIVKLKTAAPLTRSQRRREPPLRRTVLMFNTLRLIERHCSPGFFVYAESGLVPSLSVAAAGGGGQSSLIRPQVDVRKDVDIDVLPSLPSDYLFSCSFDRVDSECFCHQLQQQQQQQHQHHDSVESRPFFPLLPELSSTPSSEVGSCPTGDVAPSGGELFSSTNVVVVDEDLPIITFTSVLDFDSPAMTSARTASMSTSVGSSPPGGCNGIVADLSSNFDMIFDWPDFDAPPLPPALMSVAEGGCVAELPLSPLANADFDFEFDARISVNELQLAAGLQPVASSGTAGCSNHSATCNHRNELLVDELDRIVQQILVGT